VITEQLQARVDGMRVALSPGMKTLMMTVLALSFFNADALAMGKRREKVDGDKYNVYRIIKGAHYSKGPKLKLPTYKDSFTFKVVFDNSAKYTTVDPVNQYDVNKLIGFTDCGGMAIHKNSARLGWNWDHGQLHLYAYTYANKVRAFEKIGDIPIGKAFEAGIRISGDHYVFTYNGKETKMARGCSKSGSFKTWSYPYFGGDETAPQETKILVKW
jgi:hypothetical protein